MVGIAPRPVRIPARRWELQDEGRGHGTPWSCQGNRTKIRGHFLDGVRALPFVRHLQR